MVTVPPLKRITLACVGHLSLDHVFEIERFPNTPTKTAARGYLAQGGGMAANAAVAAARLGAQVRFFGALGQDGIEALLREHLAGEGVELGALQSVPRAVNSVSAVVVDAAGERQIFNHRGDALKRAAPLEVSQLDGVDAVLVDPRWVAGAEAALRWARARNLMSMLDADIAPRDDLLRLVPLAQWAVFSASGLALYAPGSAPREALQAAIDAGCEAAAVTRGERGVAWLHGGRWQEREAYRVDARDTTGAGDVFHSALALALAEAQPEADAVAFASAAAALKCRVGKGIQGAPRREAVLAFQAEFG